MKQSKHHTVANDVLTDPLDSIVPHILLYVTQVAALASPKFPGRRYLFSGILVGLMVQALLHPHFTRDMGIAQPFCIQWSFLVATLEKLLLSGEQGPEHYFWRNAVGEREAEHYPAFSFRKFKWAFMLILNQRGIGWNHEVKNVPQSPEIKKSVFLRQQLTQLFKYYLLADICFQLSIRFFYTNPLTGEVGDVDSKLITLDYACPGWIVTTRLVFAGTPYFALSMQYTLTSIISVALGMGTPKDWPPMFNPIREANTIRNFWGKYWHQLLRRPLSIWSNALVDTLGISHGTNMSSYTQIWLSFIVSGYFHATSHRILPLPIDVSMAETVYPIFLFFILQAAAITIEDAVQWTWCNVLGYGWGSTKRRNIVGYVWVAGWLLFSIKFPAVAYMKSRVGTESPLPFTIAGPWIHLIPMPF